MNVLGIGTAVPPHRMSQRAALEMCTDAVSRDEREKRLVGVMFRESGIENRHTVLPEGFVRRWIEDDAGGRSSTTDRGPTTAERMALYSELGTPLARTACERALVEAGTGAREVTHLVVVSCTGFEAPGIDTGLMRGLGLRATVQRLNVGFMGCHGAINGLRAAHAIVHSQPGARVLLCAVECCSLHCRTTWDRERVLGNALFADGAAALVLGGTTPRRTPGWFVEATGSCLLPNCEDAMTWRIGDHGFEMQLTSRVAEAIERDLRGWLDAWLAEHGTSRGEIAHWGIHPGGPRILDVVEQALELPEGTTRRSREVLARFGNMSSPTVLFVLDRTTPAHGSCLLLGFGPGLFAEAALLSRTEP